MSLCLHTIIIISMIQNDKMKYILKQTENSKLTSMVCGESSIGLIYINLSIIAKFSADCEVKSANKFGCEPKKQIVSCEVKLKRHQQLKKYDKMDNKISMNKNKWNKKKHYNYL